MNGVIEIGPHLMWAVIIAAVFLGWGLHRGDD